MDRISYDSGYEYARNRIIPRCRLTDQELNDLAAAFSSLGDSNAVGMARAIADRLGKGANDAKALS